MYERQPLTEDFSNTLLSNSITSLFQSQNPKYAISPLSVPTHLTLSFFILIIYIFFLYLIIILKPGYRLYRQPVSAQKALTRTQIRTRLLFFHSNIYDYLFHLILYGV